MWPETVRSSIVSVRDDCFLYKIARPSGPSLLFMIVDQQYQGPYYLVKDGRIDTKNALDRGDLLQRLDQGELGRDDLVSDCKEQRRVGDIEFLFPKHQRRIGLYGLHGSGKTSFLACCTRYGKPFENGSLIIPVAQLRNHSNAVDGSSILKEVWARLSDPAAPTGPSHTEDVRFVDFSLAHSGDSWHIRTIDYDGDLLLSGSSSVVEGWLRNCDAILILIDTLQPEQLHRFLLSVRVGMEKHPSHDKPIAVVLSQSDRTAEKGKETELSETLRPFRLSTRIFSVSVFGRHDPERPDRPDAAGPCPNGVAEPVLWLVRECDRILFDSLRKRLGDIAAAPLGDEKHDLRTLRTLRVSYQREKGLWSGGMDRLIDGRLEELDRREEPILRRNRWIRNVLVPVLLAIVCVPLLLLLMTLFGQDDATRYRAAVDRIDKAMAPETVDEALRWYRNAWWGGPHRFEDSLEDHAGKQRRRLRWERDRKDLETGLRYALNFEETKRLYDDFLEDHPAEEYPDQAASIREIETELAQVVDEERRGIQFLPQDAFAQKIERIDRHLKAFTRNDPMRAEFLEDRRRIAEDWDRHDYHRLALLTRSVRSGKDLFEAARAAESYLDNCVRREQLRVESRYRKNVLAWKEWYENLKKEHDLVFHLKTVMIPRSFLQDPRQQSELTVSVQFGTVKKSVKLGRPAEFAAQADPIRLEPEIRIAIPGAVLVEGKKKLSARLTVTESWGWVGGGRAVCVVSDSPYPYLDFAPPPDGIFVFPAEGGGEIRVEAGLEGVNLPESAIRAYELPLD